MRNAVPLWRQMLNSECGMLNENGEERHPFLFRVFRVFRGWSFLLLGKRTMECTESTETERQSKRQWSAKPL